MKVQVAVCDVCHTPDAVGYEVRYPDGVLRADLCGDHGQVLLGLRDELHRQFTATGKRRRTRNIVVNPDAI